MKDPMILVSTGNSGSSAMMHILKELGLNLGTFLKEYSGRNHYEHKWFQGVNKTILQGERFPYHWMPDTPVSEILKPFLACAVWRKIIRSAAFVEMSNEGIGEDEPWGFKDPRTCLTLPLWLRVFPKAKILFLDRDPQEAWVNWNKNGWGYSIFRKAFDENVVYAGLNDVDHVHLIYGDIQVLFESIMNILIPWLGLTEADGKIKEVSNIWHPE